MNFAFGDWYPALAPDFNSLPEKFRKEIDWKISENKTYPGRALKREIEGSVGLILLINEGGGLVKAEIGRSSGSEILDKAALALVEKIFPLFNAGEFPGVPNPGNPESPENTGEKVLPRNYFFYLTVKYEL